MKNSCASLAILFLLGISFLLQAGDRTNYVTFGPVYYFHADNEDFVRNSRNYEDIGSLNETRPAEEDPAGNWGFASDGFQVSLRFEKDSFQIGEPVIASIIVRNVSNNSLVDHVTWADQTDFTVLNEQNKPLAQKGAAPDSPFKERLQRIVQKGLRTTIEPGRQRKYRVNLRGLFALDVPGLYSVNATRNILKQDGSHDVVMSSGNAMFRIIVGSATNTALKASGPDRSTAISVRPSLPLLPAQSNDVLSPPSGYRVAPQSNAASRTEPGTNPSIVRDAPDSSTRPPSASTDTSVATTQSRRNLVYGLLLAGVLILGGFVLWQLRQKTR